MKDWIVAHCHAKAEAKAEAHLKRQGYNVYLPKYKKMRRHARRIETVIRPLFPRYIFIGFEEGVTRWRPILSTSGISHLITAGGRPLVAPSWIIEQLQKGEDDSGYYSGASEMFYREGDIVQISSGPFFDRHGTFHGISDDQRVAVLLNFMGRQVKTLISREAIRRVS